MKIRNYIIACMAGAALTLFASCSVEFTTPLYGPDGELLIYPGRVDISAETGTSPGSYNLLILDSEGNDLTSIASGRWIDLDVGTYTVLGYSHEEYFNRSGSILRLRNTSDLSLTTLPPGIMGGACSFAIIEDATVTGKVNIEPLTRKLRIEASLEGISLKNIESMAAYLNGIADGIDLAGGFGEVVKPSLGNRDVQVTTRVEDGKIIIELELLGVDLDIDMRFMLEMVTVEGKSYVGYITLRDVLQGFNGGTPGTTFTVNGVIKVNPDSSVTGTIIDWEDDGEVEIIGS